MDIAYTAPEVTLWTQLYNLPSYFCVKKRIKISIIITSLVIKVYFDQEPCLTKVAPGSILYCVKQATDWKPKPACQLGSYILPALA